LNPVAYSVFQTSHERIHKNSVSYQEQHDVGVFPQKLDRGWYCH